MKVPFDDIKLQYAEIKDEMLKAAERVLESGKYVLTQGEEVKRFEADFAEYVGCKYAVGMASGTAALHLAIAALGVGPGDEVITQVNTYIATAFAISYTGAKVVFVDAEPETFQMDYKALEKAITPRTKAIMPVHMFGHPADMDAILAIANKHSIPVVEDVAHAHGAEYNGKRCGSFGDMGCFSFYPTKTLGAIGDAGILTTDNEELLAKVRQLRYMGQKVKYEHLIVGYQERMDEIQGAFLSVKLKKLDDWNNQRRRQVHMYNEAFKDLPVQPLKEKPNCKHVYYVYALKTNRRDEVAKWLNDRGVSTSVFYPIPLHLQGAYKDLGHKPGDFPVTESIVRELLHLPVYPGMTDEQLYYVVDQVKAFFYQ